MEKKWDSETCRKSKKICCIPLFETQQPRKTYYVLCLMFICIMCCHLYCCQFMAMAHFYDLNAYVWNVHLCIFHTLQCVAMYHSEPKLWILFGNCKEKNVQIIKVWESLTLHCCRVPIESIGKNFVTIVLNFFPSEFINNTYRIYTKKLEYKSYKVFS